MISSIPDQLFAGKSEPSREDQAGRRPVGILGLARRGMDRRLQRETAALFLEEYPQWLAEMGADLQRGNVSGLCFAAHRVRGALGCVGRLSACEQARQLEACARAGDLAGAADAYAVLESALLQMAPDLAVQARPSTPHLLLTPGATP